MKTYCFDMDGVICEIDNDDYDLRSPIGKTILIMERLKKEGHTVIIHTGRHILNLEVTKTWLWRNQVPHDIIQFGKPVADLYIDDKGVRFEEWKDNTKKYL
jgi:hypothetical protein